MKCNRQFFARIGEKGGRNGKFSARKRESARHAANVRWMRYRAVQQSRKQSDALCMRSVEWYRELRSAVASHQAGSCSRKFRGSKFRCEAFRSIACDI
jgi:hypothetical protein